MCGDEYCKYAITEEGYTILPKDDKWYYATIDNEGNIYSSEYELSSPRILTPKVKVFLSNTPKGLLPKVSPERNRIMPAPLQAPAVGSRKVLVILMEFADRSFTKSDVDFMRLFNEENYNEDGAVGSVHDYYQWASYGQLDLQSDILGPYTAMNDMSYYGRNVGQGGNDNNPYALFEEAVNEAIKTIQLSDYDADGDGFVDNIHIIYAGYGEEAGAASNAIWAHEMTFNPIVVQGMKINKYSCAPELRGNKGSGISRIGPHCHEIGHALGAMDYYDTNYATGGEYQGTGKWDVMASGSWNNDGISPADFNPYVKIYNFGWTDCQSLMPNATDTIATSSQKDNIYRIDTGTQGDYFLLEYRDGKYFHACEPGEGLVIFHIGPQLSSKAKSNTINATYPQQCYVVCASSKYQKPTSTPSSYGDINSAGCPYPGTSNNRTFSETSTPAALTVSGQNTGISLTDIVNDGDYVVFNCGDIHSPDPDIKPEEVDYYWLEDFEDPLAISNWEQIPIKGKSEYNVIVKLSNDDRPDSPVAASGKGYICYASTATLVMDRDRCSCRLISPTITLKVDKKYKLSVMARRTGKYDDANDMLTLGLLDNNGNEILLNNQEITSKNEWTQLNSPIPEGYQKISITIDSDIDSNSELFIDGLRIEEVTSTTSIRQLTDPCREIEAFFSLEGKRINYLQRGLNIIRMKDGTARKVLVK
ncbi:MAG: M6 family metalloprotease domain-containing protein [Prevotella sp.]|nr:M6 family metalloprotease domain-containing protein [Prevotella sp.]